MKPQFPKYLPVRCFSDRSGNFAIYFAIISTLIFAAGGIAVDYAMLLGTKTRISNALDAASLATSRALSIGEIPTTGNDAEDYFKAVFAANMGDDAFEPTVYTLERFVVDTNEGTVSAEISIDRPLIFMPIGIGRTSQKVASGSAVAYGNSKVEVAMVLDLTGSMDGAPIVALRAAAAAAVTQLLSANTPSRTSVRISLIPYNRAVNVGPHLARYVYPDYKRAESDAPQFSEHLFNTTGLGYSVDDLRTEFGMCSEDPDCPWRDDHEINRDGTSFDTCATERKAPEGGGTDYQFRDDDPTHGMISRDSRLGRDRCLSAELKPLSSDETTLLESIENYQTGLSTAGQIGLQWAWYTLSKKWADYLPVGSKPGDMAADPELRKYIIFMTDGVFNTAYADNNRGSATRRQRGTAGRTTRSLCDAIKSAGIKIFSIGFNLRDSGALVLMEDCASPDEGAFTYYYTPQTTNELISVFSTIARSIRSLRLVR